MTATGGGCQAAGMLALGWHWAGTILATWRQGSSPSLSAACTWPRILVSVAVLPLAQLDLIYHCKGLFMKKSKHGAAGLGGGQQYLM